MFDPYIVYAYSIGPYQMFKLMDTFDFLICSLDTLLMHDPCMKTFKTFAAILVKRDKFYDFLSAVLVTNPLLKRGLF